MGTAVYLAAGLIIGELASQNRRHRAKAEELASEQAALRRVATLVAKGVSEGKVFAAVAKEVGSLANAGAAQIFRYEPDGGGGERRQARQRLGCRSRSEDRQRNALRPCP